MSTLFDKYGGFATLSALTKLFYQKLLDTPKVAHFFQDINIERLIDHQTQYLSSALGGPQLSKTIDMVTAHQHLNITEADFNLVADILEETLIETGVEDNDIVAILNIVNGLKDQIISA